ncbi:MAG: PLP-dependent aminotransferase family protein [Chloroflexi bacterium]|nr:PLP-dependent aminotransferase family protein [Chloroflexota bacterium]MCC6896061.1 PLP-dependent aminotransferase family protein [Anaerolineae bacterium]
MTTSTLPQGVNAQTISLRLGHPDPATLGTPSFQEAVRRVMASPQAAHALAYGNEQGSVDLIAYLVERINREQHLSLGAENVTITAGSTNATDMIARLYTQPGDAVIVEAPTYVDSLHVFRDHGVRLYGVPMDSEGIRSTELESLLKQLASEGINVPLLYTIPNFHNPTGITTSEQRRKAIIELARQYGVLIVEDDVYRDLAFEAAVPPSYLALAGGEHAMQIGSVSKTIAPGLRVGWIATAAEHVQRFVDCGTTQMGGGANPLAAQFVAEYCKAGSWDAHLEDIRHLYSTRRDALLDALSRYMPPEVTWTQPLGGFFVWLTLPEGLNGAAIKRAAAERGVLVASGEGFFTQPQAHPNHLRLTYSFAALEDIGKAVRILGEVVRGN